MPVSTGGRRRASFGIAINGFSEADLLNKGVWPGSSASRASPRRIVRLSSAKRGIARNLNEGCQRPTWLCAERFPDPSAVDLAALLVRFATMDVEVTLRDDVLSISHSASAEEVPSGSGPCARPEVGPRSRQGHRLIDDRNGKRPHHRNPSPLTSRARLLLLPWGDAIWRADKDECRGGRNRGTRYVP